jgi:hypothetical protein
MAIDRAASATPIKVCNVIAMLGFPLVFFGIGDSVGLMWMLLIVGAQTHSVAFVTGWIGIVASVAGLFVAERRFSPVLQAIGPACLLISAVSMRGLPYCLYFYFPALLSLFFSGVRAYKLARVGR